VPFKHQGLWPYCTVTQLQRSELKHLRAESIQLSSSLQLIQGTRYQVIWQFHGSEFAAQLWVLHYWRFACMMRRDTEKMRIRSIEPAVPDTLRPFVMWQSALVNARAERTGETLHCFTLERRRLAVENEQLIRQRHEVAEDLEATMTEKARIEERLDIEVQGCGAIRRRLQAESPELVKRILGQLFNRVFVDMLQRANAGVLLANWRLSTSELSVLLSPDEDVKRLRQIPAQSWVLRWVNYHTMKFKVLATEIQESGQTGGAQLSEEEAWEVAKDAERYKSWCRLLRAIPKIAALDEELEDGVVLTTVYASLISWRQHEGVLNPAQLWALGERDVDVRLGRICEALHTLLPTDSARSILQQRHVADRNTGSLFLQCLAALFLHDPGLPCRHHDHETWDFLNISTHKVTDPLAAASNAAVADSHEELVFLSEGSADGEHQHDDGRHPLAEESLAHHATTVLHTLAQACHTDGLCDFSPLLDSQETVSELPFLNVHDFLLRWVNTKLDAGYRHNGAALTNWNALRGQSWRPLFLLLRAVAGEVAPCEKDAELHMTDDDRCENLVKWASRCTRYKILSWDSVNFKHMNDVVAFVAALFLSRPSMPLASGSDLSKYSDHVRNVVSQCSAMSRQVQSPGDGVGMSHWTRMCAMLQDNRQVITKASSVINEMRQVQSTVEQSVSSLMLELLTQRALGRPCTLGSDVAARPDAAQQQVVPADIVWQHLVEEGFAPHPDHATSSYLREPAEVRELVQRVAATLQAHTDVLGAVFNNYASKDQRARRDDQGLRLLREQRRRSSMAMGPQASRREGVGGLLRSGTMAFEPVALVDLRGLLRLFREGGWRNLPGLQASQMEVVYLTVASHQSDLASRQPSSSPPAAPRALAACSGKGLDLHGFAEVILLTCLRTVCKAEGVSGADVVTCLTDFIERYVARIIHVGTDEHCKLFYEWFYDTAAALVLATYEPLLRAVFNTYAVSEMDEADDDSDDGDGHTVHVKYVSPMCFQQMLNDTGLSGGKLDTFFPRVFRGLRQLDACQLVEEDPLASTSVADSSDSDSDSDGDEDDRDPSPRLPPPSSPSTSDALRRRRAPSTSPMLSQGFCFVEFAEAILALALYTEPNPFTPVAERVEKFLRSRFLRHLRDHHRALVMSGDGGAASFDLVEMLEEHLTERHHREPQAPDKVVVIAPGGTSRDQPPSNMKRASLKKEINFRQQATKRRSRA